MAAWDRGASPEGTEFRVQGNSQAGQRRGRPTKRRLRLCIRLLPTASPFKAMDRRTALPASRMSIFLEFFSAAADFALTLNLKAAIVAAGFIVLLCAHALMRRANSTRGKGPGSAKTPGPPTSVCG